MKTELQKMRLDFETLIKDSGLSSGSIALILRQHKKAIVEARKTERAICRFAVAKAWAPITGTPYIAGSRSFVKAIDALPVLQNDTV